MGELSVIGGRMQEVHYAATYLSFRLADRTVDMSIPPLKQNLFANGTEMEFVVRRSLLFRKSLSARAFRAKGSSKIHSARRSQHWVGIICGLACSWLWVPDCFNGNACSFLSLKGDDWYLWLVPFWFLYAVLAVIESWQATRLLRSS